MSASTPNRLVRATVDTNLFVSGLLRPGLPAQLLRALLAHAFRLVTSDPLREEVAGVVVRPKFQRYGLTPKRIRDILDALVASDLVEPLTDLPIHCRDPKDDIVLACALAARVDYIVSGDKDLHDLAGHPALGSIRIVTAREFLSILDAEPDA